MPAIALADSDVSAEKAAQNTPEGWEAVNLPSIAAITSANTLNITDYGASTASSDNTSAIQTALNDVPSAGGMVVIPAGTWLSGCLQVKSKTVLHLAAGATLKMLDHDTFPKDDNGFAKMSSPFITGKSGASDIIIEGESQETSIIDGQGAPWWDDVETAKKEDKKTTRSAMIRFWQGERYLFRNFRIQNTPNTNITIGQSGKGAHNTAHNITIKNPSSEAADPSHNTDGFPVWTQYVNIYDCEIDTGDDNVVVDSDAQYVHAWNIVCKAGHGMSVGSYTKNLHDILYEDIDFQGTETGFRIKSNNDRSGSVYNLTFRNSQMDGVRDPIVITCLYDNDPQDPSKVTEDAVTSTTPDFHDFLFQNITAVNCPYYSHWKRGNSIYIYGRKES
jgi:polygalacturonase